MRGSAVGIDVGASYIKLVDSKGEKHKLENPGNYDDLMRMIRNISRRYDRVGIAVAGFVSPRGFVYESPNMPYISGKRFPCGRKTFVANDATLACYGEVLFGAGKRWRNKGIVACVTLGTGLGGGLVIDGRPFLGAGGISMEIGHVPMTDDKTRVCSCGRYGCVEEYVSSRAIRRYYREVSGLDATPEEVVIRANGGDLNALEALRRFAYYTSKALQIISHILNPNAIIISGGIVHHFPKIQDFIGEFVEDILIEPIYRDLHVLPARLGEFSGAYGALGMALSGSR